MTCQEIKLNKESALTAIAMVESETTIVIEVTDILKVLAMLSLRQEVEDLCIYPLHRFYDNKVDGLPASLLSSFYAACNRM
jgi:hypothetical protein